jgi:16S rRNA (cytidine1402-2'-O)-methyltransferase
MSRGELFLIATPIGNLGDITIRALETLRRVELVAAEDTRTAKKLFQRYRIKARLVSLHDNSSEAQRRRLLERLESGAAIGLISEAGTPGISDPGYRLIVEAAERGLRITPLPGPCAAISALCASALPLDSFYFAGFLPPRPGPARRRLEALKEIEATLVFYESPRRLNATLELLAEVFGDRRACVARELTKIYEEFLRGSLRELLAIGREKEWRGEITLLVAGRDRKGRDRDPQELAAEETRLEQLLAGEDFDREMSRRDLVEHLGRKFPGLKRRRIYELVNRISDEE